ncbi:MAG TPA: 4-hydroxyphenylacetate 3-hydroxylase N-terminal domain-containing protein [Amycolatopsis sp.]|uniref:4-hydroxyphenylacetate 3-hydroxylase N-terminal domain-containing protein n=1 Tax=Amycolatopsis sp. TaxID=37632 RepID=UPI002B45EF6C|nr:4-hydroxyphenylacetate 3-hydroxylase N-terminal domain-containing protein [Amycolatopsis sp.]HKS45832.1 4-hydroxyphenylacetate 3-hydroxylase N-terminal domain-containing protein [Amycolatopsis sp.]
MMTSEQYRASLDDGRAVYFDGERILDLAKHPVLGGAVDVVARGYDHWFTPSPGAVNPLLRVSVSTEDLTGVLSLFDEADALLNLTYQAIMCLLTAAGRLTAGNPEYGERIERYVRYLQDGDLRCALCITDAKGDRGLPPRQQEDPDSYTRVLERRPDGVVIRGAKLHITAGPLAHEYLVMPTKAMHAGEEDYAICCAVPLSAPGVKVVARTSAARGDDPRDHPVSGHGVLPEAFVIFDDVFVPNERIFLDGEVADAAVFAHSLGLWERLKALTHMADRADELVGLAQLAAEANGVARVPHIREKVIDIVMYATVVRSGLIAAVTEAVVTSEGLAVPDEKFTNAAKYHGAAHYAVMVRNLQDIAGGSVVTAPSTADLDNPETGPLIEKYMATGQHASGRHRTALMHAIRDLTADTAGGHAAVIQLHAGGGLHAQRLVTRKHYDIEAAKQRARELIGLPVEGGQV